MGSKKGGNYVRLLRIGLPLLLGWISAWILGLVILGQAAINQHQKGLIRGLDQEMALYAMTVYALTWIEPDGSYSSELLLREPDFPNWPHAIWVFAPDSLGRPRVLMQPKKPRFSVDEFSGLWKPVSKEQEVWRHMVGSDGESTRIHSIAVFGEDNDEPLGAVVVAAKQGPSERAQQSFSNRIKLIGMSLAIIGLLVGVVLTYFSLRPILRALQQRERFLTATAHELRTPLSALKSVCDSAIAGDEAPEKALHRIQQLLNETGYSVEQLLLMARLDAGQVLQRTLTRVDLLVEALLPEQGNIQLTAKPCTAMVDNGLMQVAVKNLLNNATRYGDVTPIRVTVSAEGIEVCNGGQGYPQEVLKALKEPVTAVPTQLGNGFGLIISRTIAQLHQGDLELRNLSPSGACARLIIDIQAQ